MTTVEILEIFAPLALAYPNAATFKGNMEAIELTANLWSSCLPDIDLWLGQQTTMRLILESKFPPTIADFREKAGQIKAEIDVKIKFQWNFLMQNVRLYGLDRAIAEIDPRSDVSNVIALMGGSQKLLQQNGYAAFKTAYERFLHRTKSPTAIPDKTQRRKEISK